MSTEAPGQHGQGLWDSLQRSEADRETLLAALKAATDAQIEAKLERGETLVLRRGSNSYHAEIWSGQFAIRHGHGDSAAAAVSLAAKQPKRPKSQGRWH